MDNKKPNKVYKITTEEQLDKILKLNLFTIIDFNAVWCGPCQRIKPWFYTLPREYKKFVFLSVDVEDAEDISARYHIKSMPTFIITHGNKEMHRVLGANMEGLTIVLEKLVKFDTAISTNADKNGDIIY